MNSFCSANKLSQAYFITIYYTLNMIIKMIAKFDPVPKI